MSKDKKRRNRQIALFTLPGFIWMLVFSYLPMFGLVIAFKDFKNSTGNFITSLFASDWTFNNFRIFFTSNDSGLILRNTILYNVVFMVLNIAVPLIVAIMLHELLQKRWAKAYQTASFLPYFLSWIVISYSVYAILNPQTGLMNKIITAVGGKGVDWYRTPGYWPFIFVFLNVWKNLGYNTIIYLAALTGIDRSLYEAAAIDGATKWEQAKHITVPLLKPVITVIFILGLGSIFRSDFGLFYHIPITGGGTAALRPVSETIDTYIYKLLMKSQNISQSAAISFVQSVIGFLLIFGANKLVKRYDPERAIY
ncbi:MAG: sugar ABC transporter permease [Tissierellia bacterium]|nr:sugar ABC transporter permease [Tissierellia bacterium]